jgi:heparin binding hemagglutinin HbhA
MTRTATVKQYGETAASAYKTLNLAVIGAGDLAVERARTVVAQFRTKAEALPGEAQVQADLAVKEARTRAA